MVTLYMILIASILLIEYRKRSGMESYKFVRRAFMNELIPTLVIEKTNRTYYKFAYIPQL
ncbi:MAG: hypothetical protein ACR5KX_04205 [Wolbachia sp.]